MSLQLIRQLTESITHKVLINFTDMFLFGFLVTQNGPGKKRVGRFGLLLLVFGQFLCF